MYLVYNMCCKLWLFCELLRMKPLRKFSSALNSLIVRLEFTQAGFADAVGISVSMVSKLLGGERAHESTYVKVFGYCQKAMPESETLSRKQAVMDLWEAYSKDVMDQFGIFDSEQDFTEAIKAEAKGRKIVSNLFLGLPPVDIFALYAVGQAACRSSAMHNLLVSLAQQACEHYKFPNPIPPFFFPQALEAPKGSPRMGELAFTEMLMDLQLCAKKGRS